MNFNPSEFYSPYNATYQLTYKRHFEKISLRAGIGVRSSSSERDPTVSWDDGKIKTESRDIDYRLGIEWNSLIGKKWNFYYGIDFRHFDEYRYNDSNHYNAGYRHGSKRKEQTFGLAPLMGIEFKINDRISLQTEASFIGYRLKTSYQPIIKQVSDNPSQPFPSTEVEKSSGSGTGFSIPHFILIAIRI